MVLPIWSKRSRLHPGDFVRCDTLAAFTLAMSDLERDNAPCLSMAEYLMWLIATTMERTPTTICNVNFRTVLGSEVVIEALRRSRHLHVLRVSQASFCAFGVW